MLDETRKFELRVTLSVMNDSNIVGTSELEKQELVDHLGGDWDMAVAILRETGKLSEAADLIDGVGLDRPRYNKLMDLYKGSHTFQRRTAGVAA